VQPDFVFHLAAQSLVKESYSDPIKTWMSNTFGTISVLQALRNFNKQCVAIFITSDKCYDNVEWIWGYRETDPIGGSDPYSGSKGAAELAIRSYVRSFFPSDGSIRIGIGRAGNVIGGGDWAKDRIVPDCITAWSEGNSVNIRNPNSTRPWQHVLEPLGGYLALALNLYSKPTLHGEAFNFGPPAEQNHSVLELVEVISKYLSFVNGVVINDSQKPNHEAGLLKLNCDKALYHLNWRATWDFETTARQTALWYKNYFNNINQTKIYDFSLLQINDYMQNAKERGQLWVM
jgi:CDP-glucose 4,6-dehydratase